MTIKELKAKLSPPSWTDNLVYDVELEVYKDKDNGDQHATFRYKGKDFVMKYQKEDKYTNEEIKAFANWRIGVADCDETYKKKL